MERYIDFISFQTRTSLLSRIRYKVGIISDLIIMLGTYIFIYFFQDVKYIANAYSASNEDASILILLGFIFWQFSVLALGFTKSGIEGDFKTGNIEMNVQSCYSLPLIYFIQMGINLMSDIIIVFIILLFTYFLNIRNSINILRILIALSFSIPSIVGMYGIGLIISGVVIREKNIGSLTIIIQTFLLFASNTLGAREGIINYIIPFSNGTSIARNFYLGRTSSTNIIISYLMINIIWFCIGYLFFNKSINKEKMQGSFDRY